MNISTKQVHICNTNIDLIRISGEITESSHFSQAHLSGTSSLIAILDLRDVKKINSHGSRLWIKWLDRLSQRQKILLYECSPVVVREMIRVSNFSENTDIISLRFPFICTQGCGQKSLISIKPHSESIKDVERCPTCDRKLIFDGISAPYYSFLEKIRSRPATHGTELVRNLDVEISLLENDSIKSKPSERPDLSYGTNETGKEFLSEVGLSRSRSAVGGLKSVVFDHSSAFDFHTDHNQEKTSTSTEKRLIYISAGLLAISLLLLLFILMK